MRLAPAGIPPPHTRYAGRGSGSHWPGKAGKMRELGYILLTGATGFLGRYLLRGLLASGQRVALLVRDGRSAPAEERVRELMSPESGAQRDRPANPVVLAGDVCAPRLGLGIVDRIWLARHCTRAVHAAA